MWKPNLTILGTTEMKTNPRKWLKVISFLTVVVASSAWLFGAKGQEARQALPTVITIAVPIYPAVARAAHVEGVVHLKISTDGHRVTTVEVQDGTKLLAVPAQDNVKTWQFSPHDPTTFVVTYRYKLVAQAKGDTSIPSVLLRLPTDVEVSAMPRETVDPAPDKTPTATMH
jgi:TonB-like protein